MKKITQIMDYCKQILSNIYLTIDVRDESFIKKFEVGYNYILNNYKNN